MTSTFLRTYPPAQPDPGPALWFPFRNDELLVQQQEHHITLAPSDEDGIAVLEPRTLLYLGTLDGVPCIACEVSAEQEVPDGWRTISLRGLFGQVDDSVYGVATYAFQILYWQRHHRYCPNCGHLAEPLAGGWGRQCPNCGHVTYPPVTPAILVLVHDGENVLLVHKPDWGQRYSIIAGFVEPGESLEGCVQREVLEEVGVEVNDIRYIGSQPWPFPHQLMVGFTARYVSGEIHPDQLELDRAFWFHYDDLPELPPPLSLARQIITTWVASQQ